MAQAHADAGAIARLRQRTNIFVSSAATEAAVAEAARQARGDGRMILGVADRVPVEADIDRLAALPRLLRPD